MRKFINSTLAIVCILTACTQNEKQTTEKSGSTGESLVQEAQTLSSDRGEKISLTFFAKGNEVAVKLQKGSEPVRTLVPSGTSERGNPVFTDGIYLWEMSQDGKSGTLTDENGKPTVYQ